MWSDEQVDGAEEAGQRAKGREGSWRDYVSAIMTFATAAMAARAEAMPPGGLKRVLADMEERCPASIVQSVREYVAGLVAMTAILEHDRALQRERAVTWRRLYLTCRGWTSLANENTTLREQVVALEKEVARLKAEAAMPKGEAT